MTGDLYSLGQRIGRVERRGRQFLAWAVDDREGALRPLGTFPTAKDARAAVKATEARYAA